MTKKTGVAEVSAVRTQESTGIEVLTPRLQKSAVIDADEEQQKNEAPFLQQSVKNYVVATSVEVIGE